MSSCTPGLPSLPVPGTVFDADQTVFERIVTEGVRQVA